MSIVCVDWRDSDGADLAQCYAHEIHRWSVELGWDTAASWDQIELGRRIGNLPGLLALDAYGAVLGWTFYLLHRGILQLGGIVSNSPDVTRALIDGVFASETAVRAEAVTIFVFSEAPGLAAGISARGLTVGTYDYLVCPLSEFEGRTGSTADAGRPGREALPLRSWRPGDVRALPDLFQRAYPGADHTRPFAPRGTPEEWREYVGQLVHAGGCGNLMMNACGVHEDASGNLSGVVLVTRLSTETAHIAQLAVDPGERGRGVGRRLVDAACRMAAGAGCTRMTLLVEARNIAARRLYDAAGFQARASFISAGGRPLSGPPRESPAGTPQGAVAQHA
jgi:ribosomal protein S18 acetylase RimI-like enzyme